MKTSNKILSTAAVFLVLAVILGMIYFKSKMIITKLDKSYVGSGMPKQVELSSVLLSDTLVLSDSYKYVLNPDNKGITAITDDNLVDQIKITDDKKLYFFREGHQRFEPTSLARIEIGVMGKQELVIILGDLAQLSNIGTLKTNLKVLADDRSNIELKVETEKLNLELENRTRVTLTGSTKILEVIAEDDANIEAKEIDVSKMTIELSDSAKMKAFGAATVDIKMEDRAVLDFEVYWTLGKVKVEDKAKFKITGKTYDEKYTQIAEPSN